jgi:hypothetical protein
MSRNGLISYEPERSLDALCSRTDSSSVTLLTIQVLKRKTPRTNAGLKEALVSSALDLTFP